MLDEAVVGYRLVLTKADKIKANELAEALLATHTEARKHSAAYPVIHVTSAEKLGIETSGSYLKVRISVFRSAATSADSMVRALICCPNFRQVLWI